MLKLAGAKLISDIERNRKCTADTMGMDTDIWILQ